MKKLWPVLSAVACCALPGCAGSSVTAEPPPVTPVAKPVAPAAVPTPIPVAAPPEMPSAPKPEKQKKSESNSESTTSSSASVQANTSQSPTQMVESMISQVQSTSDEEGLRKLETELTILKYEYENANVGLMAASMNKLAVACELKRLRQPYVDVQIKAARHDAELAEKMMREANQPQPTAEEWKQRFDAERARNGGRRY